MTSEPQPEPTPSPTPNLPLPAAPKQTVTPSGPWNLVWSDEFDGPDGSLVDSSKWSFDVGGHGWGNNELEYYTNRLDNAYLQGGNLVIRAQEEAYSGSDYTSARLVTKNKGDWLYGRFEIRAKLPRGQGIWPAIWLLPTDNLYGNWPASGEIDIMELLGSDPWTIYGTLHWGEPHQSNGTRYYLLGRETFADDFHDFALEWDPDEIRWYVDGYHYHTVTQWFTSGAKDAFPAPFDQRFHLLLNVAVGGNWPGKPNVNTQFPALMEVDYVRIYQR
jgi:beta-glucanase (GH16 family)